MKKILIFTIILLTLIFPSLSCKRQEFSLANYVVEYRENILYGENENYKIKCYYGYNVKNFNGTKISDNDKEYYLTIILLNKSDDSSKIYADFTLNGKNYSDAFSFSPVNSRIDCTFEIEKTKLTELEVKIKNSSDIQNVKLLTTIPNDTMSFEKALNHYYTQQKSYIDNFLKDELFNAKLSVRIVEKDGKAYYYIGLTDLSKKTRACLIDGISGEILAIREVF